LSVVTLATIGNQITFMQKKALILDLDNTIYPVQSIGAELFAPLFKLIRQNGSHEIEMEKIEEEIMRQPFQFVANDFHFSEDLKSKGVALLKELAYNGKMEPFDDYPFIRSLPLDKFLVTTGFLKLQESKVDRLNIRQDFKEIYIVDPSTSDKTKKDVFAGILRNYGYAISEVLVVGDDLHSEIKAASALGIEAILYNRLNLQMAGGSVKHIENFNELSNFI
jgi:putative hydrolase of the HAD superfamily